LSTAEGWTTSNLPLKGGKGWAYEGGIREPLIVRWPGVTKAGSVSNIAVSSIDYYPTLLQAAGLPLPSAQHVDGISIVPLLKGGNQKKDRTLFWHYPHYGNQGGAPFSTIMDGDFKLIKFYENGGYYELYNLKQDIGERNNLIRKYPEKVSEMKTRLDAFLTQAAAKYPVPNQKYKAN
jgi:arylsulfatase A-like enzyme